MGSAARIAADLAKTKPTQEAIDAYANNRCPRCGGQVFRRLIPSGQDNVVVCQGLPERRPLSKGCGWEGKLA